MATDSGQQRELRNETVVNVAGLLKGQVGTTRTYALALDSFAPDGDEVARQVEGTVRLTRLRDAVMANIAASGVAPLECVRCLREYDQPFEIAFDEEYRQTVDVRTGLGLGSERGEDDEVSFINENHELDLKEPLRQEILVSLPMRPDCGPGCPGPDLLEVGDAAAADDVIDDRLAALARLLVDE